jgi:hypothetical protein
VAGKAPRDDMGQLRRWTVVVMLALLVIVTVGNFVDDIAFGNRFVVDNAFYALVGGMITGLFTSEAISAARKSSNSNGRDKADGETK